MNVCVFGGGDWCVGVLVGGYRGGYDRVEERGGCGLTCGPVSTPSNSTPHSFFVRVARLWSVRRVWVGGGVPSLFHHGFACLRAKEDNNGSSGAERSVPFKEATEVRG